MPSTSGGSRCSPGACVGRDDQGGAISPAHRSGSPGVAGGSERSWQPHVQGKE